MYIVDTFGDSKFYKIATTVFLGGSITNKGGQNPLEPARYGANTSWTARKIEVYGFQIFKISKEINIGVCKPSCFCKRYD